MRAVIKITLISFFVLTVLGHSAFGFFIGFKPWKLPREYTFTETNGTVIDAETKKPIEGLVVVGMWELEWTRGPTYISEAIVTKLIHVEETVTDEKGQFTLPAPPSIKRPSFWGFNGEDPTILFFKPGYKIEFLSNYFWISSWVTREGIENYVYSKIRQSYWNGKVIDLEPFRIGRKIPIKDRYYTKERIMRYDTATQEMWEWDLGFIQGIFEKIEDADKKKIRGIPIKLAPYIEAQKVKNLLKVFAEERKKAAKPYYLDLPQRFEDYLKEMGREK
jgi:hypothetical protein